MYLYRNIILMYYLIDNFLIYLPPYYYFPLSNVIKMKQYINVHKYGKIDDDFKG